MPSGIRILIIVYCFVNTGILYSQTNAGKDTRRHLLDSLEFVASIANDDTSKVSKLLRISLMHCYIGVNLDSSRYYNGTILTLSRHLNYSSGIINAHKNMGLAFYNNDYPDSARYYYQLSLNEAIDEKDIFELIDINRMIGYIFNTHFPNADTAIKFFSLSYEYALQLKDSSSLLQLLSMLSMNNSINGDFVKALELNMEALNIAEARKDTANIVFVYLNLSEIFGEMDQKNEQMEMVRKSLLLSPTLKTDRVRCAIYATLGLAFEAQNQFDSVFYYAKELLPIAKRMRNPFWIATGYRLQGVYYRENGNIDKARQYFDTLIQVISFNPVWKAQAYMEAGKCEMKQKKINDALQYFLKSKGLVETTNDNFAKSAVYELLYETYDSLGNSLKSLNALKKHKLFSDSLRVVQSKFVVSYQNLLHETLTKNGQIKILDAESKLQATVSRQQRLQKDLAYVAGAFTILLISYVFYYNSRKSKQQHLQTVMNERLRISRELHDEVGATLSGIAMYSHLAKEQIKNNRATEVEKSLNVIQQSSGEMVNKLNDIVWLVNPEQDSLQKLIERLEEYARNMASIKNMQVKINIPETVSQINLPVESRRNIYLFCKEAINNAVKYSGGNLLELNIKEMDGKLEFSVSDNGKGFDAVMVRRGNGLENMQKRADEVGAKLVLTSKANEGTSLSLVCKIT